VACNISFSSGVVFMLLFICGFCIVVLFFQLFVVEIGALLQHQPIVVDPTQVAQGKKGTALG
jgi:hypothetical protein